MHSETNIDPGLSYLREKEGPQSSDPDAGLVARCKAGDTEAFEELVAKHQKMMLNIAYRLINDYDEACEAVQDSFVSAYRNIKTFRGEAKFSTWMTAITLNHAKNKLKQFRVRQGRVSHSLNQPVSTEDGEILIDSPSTGLSPLEQLEKKNVTAKVRECMNGLEPEYREVMILRDLQDFSYDEIGAVLKIREGTVKSRLFRAREAIKECLKKALGEFR